LNLNVTSIAELRNSVWNTSVEGRGLTALGLAINSVIDVTTGEENKRLTPGGGANLTGSKMHIEGEEAKGVGISLISQASGEAILIPMNAILVNDPSFISFVVPASLHI
jgi:hypothetical protein